jgi:hypothetical protein
MQIGQEGLGRALSCWIQQLEVAAQTGSIGLSPSPSFSGLGLVTGTVDALTSAVLYVRGRLPGTPQRHCSEKGILLSLADGLLQRSKPLPVARNAGSSRGGRGG